MHRLQRIMFGEPETKKQWTVWYYDNSITSKIAKFLFGTRGCYRKDADHINFLIPATGFIVMHDENTDSAEYVWTLQIEKYQMNSGYAKNVEEVRKKYEQMTEDGQKAYLSEISRIVPTQDMFG